MVKGRDERHDATTTERMNSTMNTTDFTTGTLVYGQDDELVGEIVEIWAETATHGFLPLTRYLIDDYGPIKGTRELLSTTHGYLQVRNGHFLGMGGRDLWIPLSAVGAQTEPSRVALNIMANVSEIHFGQHSSRIQQAA
jgi:hypothetical protein